MNCNILYILTTFEDDDADCDMVDCTMDLAVEKCPKTCFEPDICKIADCTHPKSMQKCPKTCSGSAKGDKGEANLVKMMVTLLIGTNRNSFKNYAINLE